MRSTARFTFAVSSACGLWFGLAFPKWQWAVQFAQVQAGLVRYPADTPGSIVFASMWSVLHQLAAIPLWLGAPEAATSRVLSAVLAMASFAVPAMITFAISKDAAVSLLAMFVVGIAHTFDYDAVYPIFLMAEHTYGVLGLAWPLVAVGLLGVNWFRAGSFLLGLAPAVQPAIGLPALAFALGAVLWSGFRKLPRGAFLWFGIGATAAGLSLFANLALAANRPAIGTAEASTYLAAFVNNWDWHRAPAPFGMGAALNALAALVALCGLAFLRRTTDEGRLFVLRFVTISSIAALILAPFSWIRPDALPSLIVIAMPARLLNLSVLAFIPLLFGLVAAAAGRRGRWAAAALGGLLLATKPSMLTSFVEQNGLLGAGSGLDQPVVLFVAAAATIALLLASTVRAKVDVSTTLPRAEAQRVPRLLLTLLAAVGAAVLMTRLSIAADTFGDFNPTLSDWRTDPVLEAAHAGAGPLLTAGDLWMIQLRTRRPVVLEGGTLDTLPYALPSGPPTNARLREIYGIDLLTQVPGSRSTGTEAAPVGTHGSRPINGPHLAARWGDRFGGSVPNALSRPIWEQRSLEGWQAVAARWGFRDVLTPADWRLRLPLVATGDEFSLYSVPY